MCLYKTIYIYIHVTLYIRGERPWFMVWLRTAKISGPVKKFMDLELPRKSLWIWMTEPNTFMDVKMQNKSLWTSSALYS
jgi:hypothetical protein